MMVSNERPLFFIKRQFLPLFLARKSNAFLHQSSNPTFIIRAKIPDGRDSFPWNNKQKLRRQSILTKKQSIKKIPALKDH